VAGQGRVRPRGGGDREAQADGLVHQAERERVADAVRQLVDHVERGGGDQESIGRRQDVRIIGILVVHADRVTGQLGQAGGVHELGAVRRGDHADVPALGLGKADEFR
jgi:hypothetical protein